MASSNIVPAGATSVVSPLSQSLTSSSPSKRNSNTIILVIVIIGIVVFSVFLFTKLNTLNKEVKELQKDRDHMSKSLKLIEAMAQKMGLRQNEKGEIEEQVEDDEEDDQDETCEQGEDDQQEDGKGDDLRSDQKHEDSGLSGMMDPAFLSQMLSGQFGTIDGRPQEVVIVSQNMRPQGKEKDQSQIVVEEKEEKDDKRTEPEKK